MSKGYRLFFVVVTVLTICLPLVATASSRPHSDFTSNSQFIINGDFTVSVTLVDTINPQTSEFCAIEHKFRKTHGETFQDFAAHDYQTSTQLVVEIKENTNWVNTTVGFNATAKKEYRFRLQLTVKNAITETSGYGYDFQWCEIRHETLAPQKVTVILPIGYEIVSVSHVAQWERRVQTERVVMKPRVVVTFADAPSMNGYVEWMLHFKIVQVAQTTQVTASSLLTSPQVAQFPLEYYPLEYAIIAILIAVIGIVFSIVLRCRTSRTGKQNPV